MPSPAWLGELCKVAVWGWGDGWVGGLCKGFLWEGVFWVWLGGGGGRDTVAGGLLFLLHWGE